jgi:hypothetical protein
MRMKPYYLTIIALVSLNCSHDLQQMQLDRAITRHDMEARWPPATEYHISRYEVMSNGSCRKIRAQTCSRIIRVCRFSSHNLKEDCQLQTQHWIQQHDGQWITRSSLDADN